MLASTMPLMSTSSCSSVRDMWNLSLIWRTVEGPWPKHGRWDPVGMERNKTHCELQYIHTLCFHTYMQWHTKNDVLYAYHSSITVYSLYRNRKLSHMYV